MRLTTKSRYGTRLILDLAVNAQKAPVPLSDISRRQNISFKYLEQLVRKLKLAGLVKSHRGPYGGHMLAKTPNDIKVGDIVRALEKTTAITDCAESPDKRCGICDRASGCLSRWVWVEAGKAMFERLDEITIGGLIENKKSLLKK
jgi:Rrf2 family protein